MQICFQFTAKHKFLLALAVALAILSPLKESFAEGSCTGPIYNGKFNQDEVVKKALEVIRDNSVDGRLLYDYIRKDPIPFEFKKLAGTTACIYTPKKIYINEINLSMCRHIDGGPPGYEPSIDQSAWDTANCIFHEYLHCLQDKANFHGDLHSKEGLVAALKYLCSVEAGCPEIPDVPIWVQTLITNYHPLSFPRGFRDGILEKNKWAIDGPEACPLDPPPQDERCPKGSRMVGQPGKQFCILPCPTGFVGDYEGGHCSVIRECPP